MDPKRLYQIFRACRLCGADSGYKMPIIQNLVEFDEDIDLRQQIRECVQIEVYEEDKMPPLICELCVEKIEKYYQFKEHCKETDIKTRKKLGLPLYSSCSGTMETDSKIGVKGLNSIKQEPEDTKLDLKKEKALLKKEAALKQKESQIKVKTKELKAKEDNVKYRENKVKNQETQLKSRDEVLTQLQEQLKHQEERINMKEAKLVENLPNLEQELKALKEKQVEWKKLEYSYKKKESYYKKKQEQVQKKANIELEMLKQEISLLKEEMRKRNRPSDTPDRSSRASSVTSKPAKRKHSPAPSNTETEDTNRQNVQPSSSKKLKDSKSETSSGKKSKQSSPKAVALPTPEKIEFERICCPICQTVFKTKPARTNHMRCHTVTFTNPKLACDACKVWFTTSDEISSHHKQHKVENIPYHCDFCNMDFTTEKDYHGHFALYDCIRHYVVPDVQCLDCWRYFATETLKCGHACLGEDGRRGGKCGKCGVDIELWKDLVIHEATCKYTAKAATVALDNIKCDQEILSSLLPMQVRVAKCDDLLKHKHKYHDIRHVRPDYGLDKNCVYPYSLHLRVKQEPILPTDHMVAINPEVKDEFSKDYIHWDSDEFVTDDEATEVKSLTHSCLKVIFSDKMVGKVPRKRRKIVDEKLFDTVGGYFDCNIDNIIESLEMDADESNELEVNQKDDKVQGSPTNEDSEFNKPSVDSEFDKPSVEVDEQDRIILEKITIESSVEESKKETNENGNDVSNVTPMETEDVENNANIKIPDLQSVNGTGTNEKLDDTVSLESITEQDKTECDEEISSFNTSENTKDFEKVDSFVCNENTLTSNVIEKSIINEEESKVIKNDIEIDTEMDGNTGEDSSKNIEESLSNESPVHNGETSSDTCAINDKAESLQEEETEMLPDQIKINENNSPRPDLNTDENLQNNHDKMEDSPIINDIKTDKPDCETQNETEISPLNEYKSEQDSVRPNDCNGGSEMEALMKDLSDLSGTDEIQSNTPQSEKYAEDKNGDLEHKRFMKELDAQIGESDSITPPNEKLHETKEGTQDQDLREINKQLQERMDRDLDNISDEEFNFDA